MESRTIALDLRRVLLDYHVAHATAWRRAFAEVFWESIPAIEGAVDACHALLDVGYELMCVSAPPEMFKKARQPSDVANRPATHRFQ